MDNDVLINNYGWVEEMELAIKLGNYGILGLKRKDLMQSPNASNHWKTELKMLPHDKGDKWLNASRSLWI